MSLSEPNLNYDTVRVLGGGGHAKVVVSMLQLLGAEDIMVFDDDASKWGQSLLGAPVRGPIDSASTAQEANFIIGIGDNRVRSRLVTKFAKAKWITLVHPGATVHPSARLGEGTVVFAGAVIQPDAQIGAHCIVNTGASIDHDCSIGDFVHIAPGCHLAGEVVLSEGVFMGIGSAAIQRMRVGEWTTVGAGGVVVHDLPPGCVAVGVPARAVRR